MTVHSSSDGGKSWTVLAQLWKGPAAYSCLASRGESAIALLYERGERGAYEDITLAVIPVTAEKS